MWSPKMKFVKMEEHTLKSWYSSLEFYCGEVSSGLRGLYSYYGGDPEYILRDWLHVEAYAWMCYNAKHPVVFCDEFMNRMFVFRSFLVEYLAQYIFDQNLDECLEDHSGDEDQKVY